MTLLHEFAQLLVGTCPYCLYPPTFLLRSLKDQELAAAADPNLKFCSSRN